MHTVDPRGAGQTLEIHSEDFYKELTTSLKQKVVMHMQRDFTSKVLPALARVSRVSYARSPSPDRRMAARPVPLSRDPTQPPSHLAAWLHVGVQAARSGQCAHRRTRTTA